MTRIYSIIARGLPALAAAVCSVSCSVKEDRMECPAYVTVLTDRFA